MNINTDSKINVMFLETSMRIGGTETVLTRLMRGINKEKFRPVLCCLYEPGILGEELIRQGHAVHHHLAKGKLDLGLPFRLYKLLREEKIDVLFIVNQPITQFWGVLCSLIAGVPVRITAIRSTGKVNRIKRRLFLNRMTFPWVNRVTALSQTHKGYLVGEEKIDASKISIVPNGVDLKKFCVNAPADLRSKLGLKDSDRLIGIVAMLRPEKNHEMLVKAAVPVIKKFPDAKFLVVGEGPEREKIENLAQELGVRNNFCLPGARKDIPEILNLLEITVLCSHPVVETLSNAVLEYMAAAKPVVATKVGSLGEQVDEGKTGFLIEAGDQQALSDRLIRLLENPETARQMGEAGRRRIEEYYTLESMIHQTESLFEDLLAEAEGKVPCIA